MKTKKLLPVALLALFFALAGFSGCEKENVKKADCEEIGVNCEDTNIYIDGTDSLVNITLYDKDTVTIQKYIQGKWRMVAAIGGLAAGYVHPIDTNAWNKFTCNKVFITGNATQCESMPYYFYKDSFGYHVLRVNNMIGRSFVIDKIKNDTLIYHDYGSDAVYFYFVKFKN